MLVAGIKESQRTAAQTMHNSSHRYSRKWMLLLLLAVTPLGGQTAELYPLPPPSGAPLTITPTNLPDIDCSIQDWNRHDREPVLTLLCPSVTIFAPLRIYLKLSWLKTEDVPNDVEKIVARPGTVTKIRTTAGAVMVRLDTVGPSNRPKARWVGFNGVVDVALIKDLSR
jgi:hypothetical protein